jgi:hypothetical protein
LVNYRKKADKLFVELLNKCLLDGGGRAYCQKWAEDKMDEMGFYERRDGSIGNKDWEIRESDRKVRLFKRKKPTDKKIKRKKGINYPEGDYG